MSTEYYRGPKQIIEDEVHEYYLSHVRIGYDQGATYIEGVNTHQKAAITAAEYEMFCKMGVQRIE